MNANNVLKPIGTTFLLFLIALSARAASIDSTFDAGLGASASVSDVAVQGDGKVVVAGDFTLFNGLPHPRVVRLNSDGSIDLLFSIGTGADGDVGALAVQADGKIIVAGEFNTFGGPLPRRGVVRLNSNGSVDVTFNAGTGPNGPVTDVAVDASGRILITGEFSSVNGVPRNRIARLNADGSVDLTFEADAGVNDTVNTLELQADGKILVGGEFTLAGGSPSGGVARLDANGAVDASFDVDAGFNGPVLDLDVQSDGKIVVAGSFTTFNNTSAEAVARLNANGSLDVSFNPVLPEGSVVAAVEVQANGKILLGGDFESVNGVSIDSTARLNADGSLDSSFNQSASLSGTVNALVVQNDGKVIAGGEFQVQGQAQLHIARLIGSEGPVAPIRAVITIQPADARVEAGADVTLTVAASSNTELSYRWLRNGVTIENETSATLSLEAVAQADAGDYSVEVSNAAGATVSETATVTVVASGAPRIVLQPVSATVVAGANVSFNVTATGEGTLNFQWRRNGVNLEGKTSATLTLEAVTTADAGDYTVVVSNNAGAEVSAEATLTVVATLNPGDLDLTFPPVQLTKVLDVEVQSDGKLVVSGDFSAAAGNSIARFNGNGSADLSFNTGLGANGPVLDAEVQADGKVIVAGEFTRFNLREHRFLVRLNADGSIDASFNVNPPPNAPVTDVEIQADGKVVIVGEFSSVGGQQHHHVARLNADGSVDASFSAGAGANGDIAEVDAQTGGKLVIVGSFSAVGGTARNGIARLNADGSVDASFDAKLNAGSSVTSVDVQGDGKIVITGNFNSVNGAARHNVVRLQADGSLDASFTTDVTTDGPVLDAEVQADGKIIISGSFEIVNGFSRNHVARLNADGSVDVNFRTNTTIPGEIEEVALQADGRIVAGGELFLGRLENGEGGTVIELFGSTLTGTRFEVSVRTVAGRRYALEASGSLNANAFTEVDVQNGDGSVKTLVDASATGSAKFYRVRAD